jgi:Sulfotransferase family
MIIQLQQNQTAKENVQDKDLFTFVRDPIDHFLSAYGECGYRTWLEEQAHNNSSTAQLLWNETAYDEQIQRFLNQTMYQAYYNVTTFPESLGRPMIDLQHAFPQTNFMLNRSIGGGTIFPNLKLVAELSEMPRVLEQVVLSSSLLPGNGNNNTSSNFRYDKKRGKHGRERTAADNAIKRLYYPARKDLISDATMMEICQFLAMDYFLLDYDMPRACVATTAAAAPLG